VLRTSITERVTLGHELDGEERAQLREETIRARGRWSPEANDLNERVDELHREAEEAAHATTWSATKDRPGSRRRIGTPEGGPVQPPPQA